MPRYGMVIDLHRCVGCGACAFACKNENNTRERANGQTFNWADFVIEESGRYPNAKTAVMPVLCNHCTKAPCVENCPTTPTALYKSPEGLTLHNAELCIGCQNCQEACPYSVQDLRDEPRQYSVLSYNEDGQSVNARWEDTKSLIASCTTSGAEISRLTEQAPPSRTRYKHPDYGSVRRPGIVEKCTFCAHRLAQGMEPACVEACPAEARIFGDQDDASSKISKLKSQHKTMRLKEKEGTEPNVFYIRDYVPQGS